MNRSDIASVATSHPRPTRAPDPSPPLGLYVHIPFCVKKCPYCDFVSGPVGLELRRSHLRALRAEIESSQWAGETARTVFFGGGTPSELGAEELRGLVRALRGAFDLSRVGEWTLECNPGTARPAKLEAFARLGINRLSLGVQSFHDHHLKTLGRVHGADESRQSVRWAREAGFDNLSLDLMFALPGQTLAEWERDLEEALAMSPEHLSLYHLTIEPGTEFHQFRSQGRLAETDDELAADMYEMAIDACQRAGLAQYEISNFARPGRECLHNQIYWRHEPFLSFGLSAASYMEGLRWSNTDDFAAYAQAAGQQPVPRKIEERLSGRQALAEAIMLGLRTREGVRPAALRRRFGLDMEDLHRETLEELLSLRLLEKRDGALTLTRRGTLLADEVCMRFL